MGLKALYESQDDIPEALRDHYTEDKGKFVLSVDDIDDHPKVRGVITANRENVKKREEFKTKVADLETKLSGIPEDFDAEQWATFKAGNKDDPAKKDEAIQSLKQVYEGKIANLQKKYDADMAARMADIAERDGYIDKTTKFDVLRKALNDVGVDRDFEDAVVDHLSPAIKVQRDDTGARKAIVETDLGDVDVGSFVKDWAASKGQKFLAKPTGDKPLGGKPGSGGPKTISRAAWDGLSQGDRMQKAKDGFKVIDAA